MLTFGIFLLRLEDNYQISHSGIVAIIQYCPLIYGFIGMELKVIVHVQLYV